MDDGVGVGIIRVDAERLRQSRAVSRLDRREAEARVRVARDDEADPARAEHADAVEEDHVVVGPAGVVIAFSPRPELAPSARDRVRRLRALHAALGLRQPVAFAAGGRQHAKIHLAAAAAKGIGESAAKSPARNRCRWPPPARSPARARSLPNSAAAEAAYAARRPGWEIIGVAAAARRERDDGRDRLADLRSASASAPQPPAEWPTITAPSWRMKDCPRMKSSAAAISSAVARPDLEHSRPRRSRPGPRDSRRRSRHGPAAPAPAPRNPRATRNAAKRAIFRLRHLRATQHVLRWSHARSAPAGTAPRRAGETTPRERRPVGSGVGTSHCCARFGSPSAPCAPNATCASRRARMQQAPSRRRAHTF